WSECKNNPRTETPSESTKIQKPMQGRSLQEYRPESFSSRYAASPQQDILQERQKHRGEGGWFPRGVLATHTFTFHLSIRNRSFIPIWRTVVGSNPQWTIHWAHRGSAPDT